MRNYSLLDCGAPGMKKPGWPLMFAGKKASSYILALRDPVTDLTEDMAAKQKARATYEHLIYFIDDSLVRLPAK